MEASMKKASSFRAIEQQVDELFIQTFAPIPRIQIDILSMVSDQKAADIPPEMRKLIADVQALSKCVTKRLREIGFVRDEAQNSTR
jgi:hypothetical protein